MGSWLGLTQLGLLPCKKRQASWRTTAASFYVDAAVKFPDIRNSSPAGAAPRCRYPAVNLGRSICPYNQFRLITLLAASLHVGRPCASNELLSVPVPFTSHPMPFSLFSDLGSSSVSAPSERRFFLGNPLAARATHTS